MLHYHAEEEKACCAKLVRLLTIEYAGTSFELSLTTDYDCWKATIYVSSFCVIGNVRIERLTRVPSTQST